MKILNEVNNKIICIFFMRNREIKKIVYINNTKFFNKMENPFINNQYPMLLVFQEAVFGGHPMVL